MTFLGRWALTVLSAWLGSTSGAPFRNSLPLPPEYLPRVACYPYFALLKLGRMLFSVRLISMIIESARFISASESDSLGCDARRSRQKHISAAVDHINNRPSFEFGS